MAKRQAKQDKQLGLKQRQEIADWTAADRPANWKWRYATPALPFFDKVVNELDKRTAAEEQQVVSEKVVALQEEALALYKKDESNAKRLGKVLLDIRDLLKPVRGAFTKWWTFEGLDQNRVSYCMMLADPEGNKVTKAKKEREKKLRFRVLSRYKTTIRDFWDAKERRDLKTCEKLYGEIHTEMLSWLADAKRPPVAIKERKRAASASA
jgi:hypothetical protein